MNVWFGTHDNPQFSNLAYRPFTYRGYSFKTVEHAYQSFKSGSFDPVTFGKQWSSGAKFRGRRAKTTGDWNLRLMKSLLWESFSQNPDVAMELAKTRGGITHNSPSGHSDVWTYAFPALLAGVRTRIQYELLTNNL